MQERIAGDVLSLARIQLDTLSIHGVPTSIRQEAQKVCLFSPLTELTPAQTVSAFAAETKMKHIEVEVDFGQSVSDMGITHINTDHVRLRQIVTNLISNAIRFTANSPTRKIVVRYDVARLPPEEETCAVPVVEDVPPFSTSSDALDGVVKTPNGAQLEDGTPLWLFVSVTDTGPGLTAHESNILFQRFTRESPSALLAISIWARR